MWNPSENDHLKKLSLDPARHTREKLIDLVQHFKKGGTLFSVTDKGEPHAASQDCCISARSPGDAAPTDALRGRPERRSLPAAQLWAEEP